MAQSMPSLSRCSNTLQTGSTSAVRNSNFMPIASCRPPAHQLRHTAESHMANSDVDLRHLRDDLGHESISTTSNYLHSSDDKRHNETEQKHRIKW